MAPVLINILTIIVMVMVGFVVLVRYLETKGVFFPSQDMPIDPMMAGLPCEDVYFKTKDGITLNGWFFKNPKARSTLIFAHGNAGNMCDRLYRIQFFYDLGLSVFIFDYRGYGKSEGSPSEAGIYLDAQAAYDQLQSRGDVEMGKIILYGASLGGIVMIDLATHRNAALLVIESSITNAQDMARIYYPFVPFFILSLKFNSIEKVRKLDVPKLFIHSPEDQVVPYAIGQKLYDAAAGPKEFLTIHGGHNDGSITAEPAAAGEFKRILKSKELI